MNFLDNLISFISPEAGARRQAWRQNLEEMKSYDAGNFGRLNAGWYAYNQSAEQTDRYNRETVSPSRGGLDRNKFDKAAVITAPLSPSRGGLDRNVNPVHGGYTIGCPPHAGDWIETFVIAD